MDDNFFSRIKGSNKFDMMGDTIDRESPNKLFFGSMVTSMRKKDEVLLLLDKFAKFDDFKGDSFNDHDFFVF